MNHRIFRLRPAFVAAVLACIATQEVPAQQPAEDPAASESATRPQQRQHRAPTWLMPKVEGANLHYETFDSPAAGEKVSYLVYLPPNYNPAASVRYPVVYWLHGIGGSQQGVPGICDRLTQAIREGKAPPMLMVFVNGMVDSFWCDAINLKRPVETVFIRELLPLIDTKYRTITAREGRMIEGFSMGGYGAGHFGFKYPELFGSVSILDGAVLSLATMKQRHADIFQRVWDGNDELCEAAHPASLAAKNVDQIKGRQLIRQAVGTIVGDNRTLRDKFAELGIAAEYVETGARHNPGEVYEKLGDANWAFYQRAFKSAVAGKPEAMAGFKLEGTNWSYDDGNLKMEGILMKPEGKGPFPALLISHGRGGSAAVFGKQKAREFVRMGFVCIAPNYTHAGRASGSNASEGGVGRRPEHANPVSATPEARAPGVGPQRERSDAQLVRGGPPGASPENLRRASKCLDILQSLPYVDGARLAAYGNSMGAFITVALSAEEAGRLKATAITAGGTRMRDGAPMIPAGDIPRVPMSILHGGTDGTVPPESSAELKELLDQNHTPNERHVFDGIGHNLHQQKANEVYTLIRQWFAKYGVLKSS